jgi:hypothetical protein
MTFYHPNPTIKTQLSQSNLSRARHRYRGPRESHKINLEITQFLYDVTRLYQLTVTAEDTFHSHMLTLTDGGQAIPDLDVVGLTELTIRTQRLRDRVLALEA